MKTNEVITLILAIITGLILPIIINIFRGAVKWARVESKLDNVIEDLRSIVSDKDKVHTEIYTQMREDRAATDKRLRWLEEYVWKKSSSESKA